MSEIQSLVMPGSAFLKYTKKAESGNPVKSKIYFMCEGRTEKDYFEHVGKTERFVNKITVSVIPKIGLDRDETDRVRMVDLAKDYVDFEKTGLCSLRRFITIILNSLYREICEQISDEDDPYLYEGQLVNSKQMCEELRQFRECLIDKYDGDERIDDRGFVIKGSGLECDIEHDCSKYLDDFRFMGYKKIYSEPSNHIGDSVCMVFDRDYSYKYFNRAKYKETLEKCYSYGYNKLISTPKFEFWLLMHFDIELKYYQISYQGGEYVSELLSGFDENMGTRNEKYIDDERFDKYYRKTLDQALQQSTEFTNDPERLENEPGTSIGSFLRSIIGSGPS